MRCLLATAPDGTEVKSIVSCDHSSYNDILTGVILLISPNPKQSLHVSQLLKLKFILTKFNHNTQYLRFHLEYL